MKHYLILLFALTLTLPSCAQESEKATETATYYLIRHEEKDRTNIDNKDPHLTEKGLIRAE
jgi:hypothetical protein